jgi:hypothetical protein
MGWREKLGLGQRESSGRPPPPAGIPTDTQVVGRWRNVKVVGESNYQTALWAAAGVENRGQRVAVECIAELVPEPDNPHDPKAIVVRVSGQCVGYLSRGVARRYGKRITEMRTAGQPTICDAFIGGLVEGDTNPNLGITLKFPVHEDGDYSIEPGAAAVARRTLADRDRR